MASASAQTCSDYIAISGVLLEGPTACYFGDERGPEAAFIRTDHLTRALALESTYDQETGRLRFRQGELVFELATTSDPEAALEAQPEALIIGGEAQPARPAVLAGSSYLPLTTVVAVLGGQSHWSETARMIEVSFSDLAQDPAPEALTAAAPDEAASGGTPTDPTTDDASTTGDVGGEAGDGAPPPVAERPVDPNAVLLSAPRYGVHDGYTRVALDLPAGLGYQLAVEGDNFIVLFTGARAEPFQVAPQSPQLATLGYAEVGDTLALIASTTYPLTPEGDGFDVGLMGDEERVLYIDFAPEKRGEAVARLQDLPRRTASAPVRSVRRPEHVPKTVVIDPGHGGHDPGAVSRYVVEKDLVLAVGLKLEALLEARGINVVMTRRDDTFVDLETRAEFAIPSEHNLFISLHANSVADSTAHGIETWVFGKPQDESLINLAILENGGGGLGRARTAQAQEIAASISGDLLREENLSFSMMFAEALQNELVFATESENRGVRQNYFSVLRNARVPAVLVELGFVNHPVEGPRLASEAYQTLLAEALAEGIEAFLNGGGDLALRRASSN
ncbi:cell wall hydrolase/autolysin [Truepera radiovictrix DSM 17093]|uniref:Cell wall hydrolase/autolysin n=2 Tax=Truepera TaxID=332248 RepID=D7CVN9_TRURR|nr:cell wall hydrolase/autolysin [Truepera radiovictrix DSM 17093]